jgi:hypothetical protein
VTGFDRLRPGRRRGIDGRQTRYGHRWVVRRRPPIGLLVAEMPAQVSSFARDLGGGSARNWNAG